jgi:signal transduction histidine kinase
LTNSALKHSLDALAADPDLDRFIGHTLTAIAHQFNSPLTEYWTHPETDDTAYINLTYWQGQLLQPSQQPGHPGTIGMPIPANLRNDEPLRSRQRYILYQGIGSKTDEVSQQISAQMGIDVASWYTSRGVTQYLNLPLRVGEKTIGALSVYLPGDRTFAESTIELAHALTQQLALAIQLTQLAEAAKQAAIFQERSYIATEVHDTLAQDFAGISMQLQAFHALQPLDSDRAQVHLNRAQDLCRKGLVEARRSVWCLQQDSDRYRHLLELIHHFIEQLNIGSPVPVHFQTQGTAYPINPEAGRHLLRIVQEALTNAIRHAHAQTIQVQLTYSPGQLAIAIQDDGCGFDRLTLPQRGFGLEGMQQRATLIDARLVIHSSPGSGTEVTIEFEV